jgi:L-threonylcarbamoyladenylate synthase
VRRFILENKKMAIISSSIQEYSTTFKSKSRNCRYSCTKERSMAKLETFSETALKKIFQLKQRPFYNPLIVHIKSVSDLPLIASEIPKKHNYFCSLLARPLTSIIKKSSLPFQT